VIYCNTELTPGTLVEYLRSPITLKIHEDPASYIQSGLLIRLSFILNRFSRAGWTHYVKLCTAILFKRIAEPKLTYFNLAHFDQLKQAVDYWIHLQQAIHTKCRERAHWTANLSLEGLNLSSHHETTDVRFSAIAMRLLIFISLLSSAEPNPHHFHI